MPSILNVTASWLEASEQLELDEEVPDAVSFMSMISVGKTFFSFFKLFFSFNFHLLLFPHLLTKHDAMHESLIFLFFKQKNKGEKREKQKNNSDVPVL